MNNMIYFVLSVYLAVLLAAFVGVTKTADFWQNSVCFIYIAEYAIDRIGEDGVLSEGDKRMLRAHMEVTMARPHIEFIQAQVLPWDPTPLTDPYAGTDIKILSFDDETGESSNLLRYPAGWTRSGPEYLTVDEEFFVLRGSLQINGIVYGDRCYAHLPAGYTRQSVLSQNGAVVLTFFSGSRNLEAGTPPPGFYDEARLVERIDALQAPLSGAFRVLGVEDTDDAAEGLLACAFLLFREDPYNHEQTWILCARPLWQGGIEEIHPVVEEMYLVAGELIADTGIMLPGAYFWRPGGKCHGPFGSKTGNMMFFRTKGGPLHTTYPETGKQFTWTPEHNPILPDDLAAYGKQPGREMPCY